METVAPPLWAVAEALDPDLRGCTGTRSFDVGCGLFQDFLATASLICFLPAVCNVRSRLIVLSFVTDASASGRRLFLSEGGHHDVAWVADLGLITMFETSSVASDLERGAWFSYRTLFCPATSVSSALNYSQES